MCGCFCVCVAGCVVCFSHFEFWVVSDLSLSPPQTPPPCFGMLVLSRASKRGLLRLQRVQRMKTRSLCGTFPWRYLIGTEWFCLYVYVREPFAAERRLKNRVFASVIPQAPRLTLSPHLYPRVLLFTFLFFLLPRTHTHTHTARRMHPGGRSSW
jgi:hypothetical protein